MTITEELRSTNGHSGGRTVVQTPTITLSSGIAVGLRRQPADAWANAQAAAQSELADSKPSPPTQSLETEPGVFRDIPNEHDPAYQLALDEWRSRVSGLMTEKLLRFMQKYALVFDIDHERLKELRAEYAEFGMTNMPEDDRIAYLSYIVAPTLDDQSHLFEEVFGRSLPQDQQVALHRAMFSGNVA